MYSQMIGGRSLVGKAYREAFPEIDGTPLADILDRAYATGEPFTAQEYRIPLDRKGTGTLEECYFRFTLQPVRDGRGLVYGMMAMAVDITEQVTARLILEKVDVEREALLTQLKAANYAKDEFLATISHELRTPLTSILGWSRLLREGAEPERVAKGLAVIEKNANAQVQLIEDVLDVSRIISGKIRMKLREVDAAAVVNAAIETVRPSAAAKRIRMSVDLPPNLPPLVADEDRLQQVVWNLLSNAVKFTDEGGSISLRCREQEGKIVLSVADSGLGISPEFLPYVFDRFRQDDTSTTKSHSGLGLGLSIARHLVELHGGRISAFSEGEGKGATFEVVLPIRTPGPTSDSIAPPPPTNVALPAAPAVSGRLRGISVLVVDDHDDARDLLATVLEDAGAAVSQADSVERALLVLAAEKISVVVSDIGMPGEDGYSLVRRMRSSGTSPPSRGLPALALTAYVRPEDRRMALEAGFQEHAAKPIDPKRLVDIVAELAGR